MTHELTWHEAIQKVLHKHPSGLHYSDITEEILNTGLKQQVGATPAATVNANITTSIKKSASDSPYVRIEKGVFALKSFLSSEAIKNYEEGTVEKIKADEAEGQIIQGFGMYWSRNAVEWKAKPKILGVQSKQTIDFGSQQGIYLLHDGSKTIYVGQTEGGLGQRLFQHTQGRMAFRWDRFSWFGICPINDDGTLAQLPKTYSSKGMLTTLEALLIEAMEPGLNRQRGKHFEAAEYAQFVDKNAKLTKLMEIVGADL